MNTKTTIFQPENKAEIAVLKTISSRLKEAREICKLKIEPAAQLLEISPNDLKRIEDDVDVCSVPLQTIRQAALVYDVSTDWLIGISADWEHCQEIRQERDFAAHLQSIFIAEQSKIAAEIVKKDNQITVLSNTVTELAPAIKSIYSSILRFWELNQNFDDMRGGASVINDLDKADKLGHEATCQMVRFNLLPISALQGYPIKEPKSTRK